MMWRLRKLRWRLSGGSEGDGWFVRLRCPRCGLRYDNDSIRTPGSPVYPQHGCYQ